VLHRSLGIDERPMPADKFKSMREAMLSHVPEDHRATFKGAIRNGSMRTARWSDAEVLRSL
jgi:hypothetical protein